MKRIVPYIVLIIFVGVLLSLPSPALAADDNWMFSAGAMQAITTDGESFNVIDLMIKNPEGPVFFQLLPDRMWGREINTPRSNDIYLARYSYKIGQMSNFEGSFYQDNEDYGPGATYKFDDHIDFPAEISGWVDDDGMIFAIDTDYEFTDGYGFEFHGIYKVNGDTRGEFLIWHNAYPEGNVKLKAGYVQWDENTEWNKGYWILGLWTETD